MLIGARGETTYCDRSEKEKIRHFSMNATMQLLRMQSFQLALRQRDGN